MAMLFFCGFGRTARAEPVTAPEWKPLPLGLDVFLVSYFANLAVSLSADRDCAGRHCNERYYSLVPVAGGALQFGLGGLDFHDHHHGSVCLPLTLAAVAGQAGGLSSLLMFPPSTRRDWRQASIGERITFGMGTYGGGTGVGVGVGFYD